MYHSDDGPRYARLSSRTTSGRMKLDLNGAWEFVVASSSGAAVYLDTAAAELCRLAGIQFRLWKAGAHSINELGQEVDFSRIV